MADETNQPQRAPTPAPEPPAEKSDALKKSSTAFNHPRLWDVTDEYLGKNMLIIGGGQKPTKTEE